VNFAENSIVLNYLDNFAENSIGIVLGKDDDVVCSM